MCAAVKIYTSYFHFHICRKLLKYDTCLEYFSSILLSVQVSDAESTVGIEFTPTIPHCSMATLIGLSIKVKLLRSLPDRFKVCFLTVYLPGRPVSSYLSYVCWCAD